MIQFIVILNKSEHFILYSANQQLEKVKTKQKMAQTSEDCFFNIEQILCKMSAQKLSSFVTTLAINSEQITNKSRRDLKYVITKTLEEKLDDEERTEEQKCEVFRQILEDLNCYNDETNTGNSNQPKKDSTQKHGDTAAVGEHNQTSRGNGNLSPLLRELNQRTSLLRKELKIKGQIVEAHQIDKLISLIHQIKEAQEAGYDESEIVNSVIRAMSPSLTWRNGLETTSNLSLQHLLQFLESQFEEKSATDL